MHTMSNSILFYLFYDDGVKRYFAPYEPWDGMAVWLVACRNKKSTSWIHILT